MTDIRYIINEINALIAKNNLDAELYDYTDNSVSYIVEWGDWKHSHAFLDYLVSSNFHPYSIREKETETDGSDTYSSIHTYKF